MSFWVTTCQNTRRIMQLEYCWRDRIKKDLIERKVRLKVNLTKIRRINQVQGLN